MRQTQSAFEQRLKRCKTPIATDVVEEIRHDPDYGANAVLSVVQMYWNALRNLPEPAREQRKRPALPAGVETGLDRAPVAHSTGEHRRDCLIRALRPLYY
ncbi:MAG: hypothetical protein ACK5AZ_20570 [Bryobacteraceae bacterium]